MRMTDELHVLVCSMYRQEVETLKERHAWNEVVLHTYPPACLLPKLKEKLAETVRQAQTEFQSWVIVGSCPLVQSVQPAPAGAAPSSQPPIFSQCFYNLVNRELVDQMIGSGSYLMTVGWLDQWKQHLHAWGFDQATAVMFFQECIRKIVLLDTGVGTCSEQKLIELGEYLAVPVERMAVGLDLFDLVLAKQVLAWRWANQERKFVEDQRELKRNLANYAMTLDLMPVLSQKLSEDEVIDQITEIVQMLFSPRLLQYQQVKDGQVIPAFQNLLSGPESERLSAWAIRENDEYAWIENNQGFSLRFTHQQETVGVLWVADLIFPQYIHHYLNLALSMAAVCGLAIANARMLQRLYEAEQLTLHEKEISETLCQVMSELTSQFEQDEVFRRILLSLYRVIPYAEAAIFILHEEHLFFKIGLTHKPGGELMPYQPALRGLAMDFPNTAAGARLLTQIDEHPNLRQMHTRQEIGSWMGIPLLARDQFYGLLSVISPEAHAYGKSEITLAHSFANAINSAHVLKEATILAATDALTGVYNRRSFFELAQKEFLESEYFNRPLSVLMVDVDRFKQVNDTYGHGIGDFVLVKLAELCIQKIRSADILGRYGGEEFGVILPGIDCSSAVQIAERLRSEVAEMRVVTERGEIQVTVSLGLACRDADCTSLEQLLKRSDLAMYQAKQGGRNQVVSWQPGFETSQPGCV